MATIIGDKKQQPYPSTELKKTCQLNQNIAVLLRMRHLDTFLLNKEQKEFIYHVLHLIKTSNKPFHCFLSTGAGVAKSHLTKALYQAALKYYNTGGEIKVLMLARTGKAAYVIKGNTIHSALGIPACQSFTKYKHLGSSRLNTLRRQLGGVKLIFIHEISMVGNTMFKVQINNRLKDVKNSMKE